ncbi:MAG: DUF1573 domain-containing protein [Bacteroidales bacterium]|nr:DUF1573 domain-containing protein [Bacteroidales bacterium]
MGRTAAAWAALVVLLSGCHPVHGPLAVDRMVYDAGLVQDTVETLTHVFTLHNRGRDTCFIIRMDKSCSCTGLKLDSKAIPPGGTARLEATLSLAGAYGVLDKSITLHVQGQDHPLSLRMLADRVKTLPVPSDYPYSPAGPAAFSLNTLFAGYVRHGDRKEVSVHVFNTSPDKPLSLHLGGGVPAHVEIKLPPTIRPRSVGRLTAVFDFRKEKKFYGEFSPEVILKDHEGNRIPLPLYAVITDPLSQEDLPRPAFYTPVNGYAVLASEKDLPAVKKHFEIANTGMADLLIRKVDVSLPVQGISVSVDSPSIAPGESGGITVTVPGNLPGRVEFAVTTNDPVQPYRVFFVLPFAQP